MNKKISGIVGVILSIVILIYLEPLVYMGLDLVGINVSNLSSLLQTIINVGIKLSMCFLVYIVYKRDFRKRNSKDNLLKNMLLLVVSLIILTLVMYLFKYAIGFIGDIFNIKVLDLDFYNIFNKTLNLNLIVKIITDYIMVPFLYCSIIILSVNKFCKRNDTTIVFSGLLASVVHAFTLSGTLGFVIVNSLYMFILFAILALLYKKTNSILFIITLYSFYLISNVFIINYLGW